MSPSLGFSDKVKNQDGYINGSGYQLRCWKKFTGNSFFGRGTGIESYLLSWKLLARQVRVVAKEKEKEGGRAMAG